MNEKKSKKVNSETNLTYIYRNRRKRLMDQINEGIVLIHSGGSSPEPDYYDKNLQYLTGLPSKQACLLLAPRGVMLEWWKTLNGPEVGRGKKAKEVLFIDERSDLEKFMEGEGLSIEEVKELTGVEVIYRLSKMNEILEGVLKKEVVLWLNAPYVSLAQLLTPHLVLVNNIRERFFWVQLKNIAPMIHEMRRVKDSFEIECLRKAFEINTEIFEKIMMTLKSGHNESLGQAIFDYEVKTRPKEVTDSLDLYPASIILASGKNAAFPHYMENNQDIKDGDLILIDSGISYKGYSSDITRTFPANGKFTPRQRELYSIVLEAQKLAINTMKPGSTNKIAHEVVYNYFKEHNLHRYGYGRCGHPVGLNIHDATEDRDIPFDPGVVLVIEPFLMIPEEDIGIRLEDGILITENGYERLPGPPREIDEVESLCNRLKKRS